MSYFKKSVGLIIASSLFSLHAMANMTVISEGDQTINAQSYLKYRAPEHQVSNQALKSYTINQAYFPVKSNLTSDKVASRQIDKQFKNVPPFFIIGDDTRSLTWLKANQSYLKKIGAMGVITNINDVDLVDRLSKKYQLFLMPASLEGIDKNFGLKHYPALVYNGWIVQ